MPSIKRLGSRSWMPAVRKKNSLERIIRSCDYVKLLIIIIKASLIKLPVIAHVSDCSIEVAK